MGKLSCPNILNTLPLTDIFVLLALQLFCSGLGAAEAAMDPGSSGGREVVLHCGGEDLDKLDKFFIESAHWADSIYRVVFLTGPPLNFLSTKSLYDC